MDLKDFHVQVKKVRLRLLKNAPYFGMALIKLARVRESSISQGFGMSHAYGGKNIYVQWGKCVG